jgi:hypothetical protein
MYKSVDQAQKGTRPVERAPQADETFLFSLTLRLTPSDYVA